MEDPEPKKMLAVCYKGALLRDTETQTPNNPSQANFTGGIASFVSGL